MSRIWFSPTPYFTPTPIHPLLIATLFLAFGIGRQAWAGSCFLVDTLGLVAATITALYLKKINPLVFFASFALGALLYKKQITEHEQFFLLLPQKPITAIVTVTNAEPIPDNTHTHQLLTVQLEKIFFTKNSDLQNTSREPQKSLHLNLQLPIGQNKQNQSTDTWQKVDAQVQIYLTRTASLIPGDKIAIMGLKMKKTNNADFDFYLAKEGIAASCYLPKLAYAHLYRPRYSWRRFLWHIRMDLITRIQEKLSRKTFALFSSIFLGNRQIVKKEMNLIKDYYKTWGISHHLARAGLHLIIFIAIWGLLLNILPLPFIGKQLLLIALCIIYLLLSWTSTPFIRAFFTFCIYKLCVVSKTSSNTIHTLTIVTFCMLLFNPALLFFLDFQLSFGITGALAWFNIVTHIQNRPLLQKY
jgi:ComEC/Rec2-related protein